MLGKGKILFPFDQASHAYSAPEKIYLKTDGEKMCQAGGAGLVIIRSDRQGDRNNTHCCGSRARLDFEQAARVLSVLNQCVTLLGKLNAARNVTNLLSKVRMSFGDV